MNQDVKTTPTAKNGGRLFRNDVIFIVVLLFVVSALGLCFYLFRGEGDSVVVTVDGKEFGRYSLTEDITVEIRTGAQNEELNLLVIKDGQAYVETATCPDGICAGHKPISREGESIVCLPHKVVITVYTTEEKDAPDIVV
ncbi:MAG: NusG domain II-containing protein [Lachnospiraceae bacterium]|nr:NusG domain II-containing protein [Lachnospiraceae bacterium]